MTDLTDRILVPIANEADAVGTYDALSMYLDADTEIVVIHVIEKAGGGIDKASVEQRREIAEQSFEAMRGLAESDDVPIETQIHYGTDVAETINDAAAEHGATTIAFRSRGGGRILDFLSGSVRTKLVTDSDVPLIVLPRDGTETEED
ncbi:universal stress protein [Halopenitus persicus]|uniref:Nucleotide-binding universal stress protein, UspA family n=1 Tax=Halopenitus persicus TaxID=1048396 RepID=A0A1H3EIL2_9EURY|nr:universal stress protein [Halopenitus persicus]QHS17580.1 universal stress protein [haloarchaeon 3A1-DGR]SDX78613.1 Nucleotide-binding universal stress protein, UspA family [Halopenitus persicus]